MVSQICTDIKNNEKFVQIQLELKKKKQQLANDFPIPSPKQECSGLKDCSVSQCIKSISAVADWPVGPSTANSTFVFVISIGLVTCLAYPALFIFLLRRYLKKIFFFRLKVLFINWEKAEFGHQLDHQIHEKSLIPIQSNLEAIGVGPLDNFRFYSNEKKRKIVKHEIFLFFIFDRKLCGAWIITIVRVKLNYDHCY